MHKFFASRSTLNTTVVMIAMAVTLCGFEIAAKNGALNNFRQTLPYIHFALVGLAFFVAFFGIVIGLTQASMKDSAAGVGLVSEAFLFGAGVFRASTSTQVVVTLAILTLILISISVGLVKESLVICVFGLSLSICLIWAAILFWL